MKILKKIGLALILVFVVLQFFQPEKNSSKTNDLSVFITETNPSKNVKSVLQNACYDCHSNTTNYPLYGTVAPVSYLLDHHINEGKEHLNFSEWETYPTDKKIHKLEELVEEVQENKMPLNEYTWLHTEANLKNEEKTAVIDWANKTKLLYQLKIKQD